MKKVIMLMFLSLFICSCESNKATITKVDCVKSVELMNEGAILIDVRSVQEYNSYHLNDAINIDYQQIESKIASEVPDKEQKIIVYCQSGTRSNTAANTLIELGYTNVYDLGAISNCSDNVIKGN